MIKKIFLTFSILIILGVTFTASIFLYYSWSLPKLTRLSDYNPPIPTKILSRNDEVLAELRLQNREVVEVANVPKVIINAFTSAEDSTFFEHSGVNILGIARAMLANLKAGRIVQGGSTITQQVAKALLLSREKSYIRKIKDFLLAIKIEKHFSKSEILHLYLNQVYLGGGYYGIKTAFEGYFNKKLSQVNIAESAMLAGLLVAPGRYSPYLNPKRAKIRQEYVLGRMYANKKINEEEYKEAMNTKLKFMLRKPNHFKAAYFTDWVLQRLTARFGKESLLRDGYTIKTTIDLKLQTEAEKQLQEGLRDIDKRQGFQGALSKIDISTLSDVQFLERQKYLKEISQFFTIIKDTYSKEYEYEVNEDFLLQLDVKRSQFKKIVKNRHFLGGNDIKNDQVFARIDKNEYFKATVEKVDKNLRIVYVKFKGLSGIIPYNYYKWAHERVIKDSRQYFPYVKDPNSILKIGDQILIKILNKNVKIKKYMNSDFVKYFDKMNSERKEEINKQSYILVSLEQEPKVQGAIVGMDPHTGEIKSLVGGYSYKKSKYNRALQAHRQPGSSFKPFLYAAALENGYTPASILIDSPEALQGMSDGLSWKPKNYDGKFKGPITLRESLEHSRNVPTIKIASDVGVPKILDFLTRIKFNAKVDKDLSMSLGTFGVTLKDIVKSYSIFPNGGKSIEEKSIVSIFDRNNNSYKIDVETEPVEVSDENLKNETTPLDSEVPPKANKVDEGVENPVAEEEVIEKPNPFLATLTEDQVYDSRLSYLMVNLLRGVVKNGTGRRARYISPYIGGKTGTTNNYVDALFIGFSNRLVTGVWTGFDDNSTMGWGETGSKAALPIWSKYMEFGKNYLGDSDFTVPEGIINLQIDQETGKPATKSSRKLFMESFVEGTEPGSTEDTFKSISKDKSNNVDDELYFED